MVGGWALTLKRDYKWLGRCHSCDERTIWSQCLCAHHTHAHIPNRICLIFHIFAEKRMLFAVTLFGTWSLCWVFGSQCSSFGFCFFLIVLFTLDWYIAKVALVSFCSFSCFCFFVVFIYFPDFANKLTNFWFVDDCYFTSHQQNPSKILSTYFVVFHLRGCFSRVS